jgi:hypothetical protein
MHKIHTGFVKIGHLVQKWKGQTYKTVWPLNYKRAVLFTFSQGALLHTYIHTHTHTHRERERHTDRQFIMLFTHMKYEFNFPTLSHMNTFFH